MMNKIGNGKEKGMSEITRDEAFALLKNTTRIPFIFSMRLP